MHWFLGCLIAVGLLATGCGEINDMLDAGAGEKPAAAGPQATADTAGQSAREKLDAYYNREPREFEQDPNDPVVTCRLRGKTQFMRRSDCKIRGGSEKA